MAKRHGNLFGKIVDDENLYKAYRKARRGKSRMKNVQKFEKSLKDNLLKIKIALMNKTFKTSPYQIKKIHEPKERDIYILPFNPDRIVQHAAMNVIEPIWDKLFIQDSYACRTGKGIHAGSSKTMQYVRQYRYCLKCDISKFYPSIRHDTVFDIVKKKIKCPETLWLLKEIINSVPGEKNIPIGNYTSQWLGNLYLNELDQHLKHECQVRAYIRYCDDFCLFHDDKRYLRNMADVIVDFLRDKLDLTLSRCDLFPVSRGVDFLGYRHFRKYILLRKSTAKRMQARLKKLPVWYSEGKISLEYFRSSLASTRGWLKWANTHNLAVSLEVDKLIEMIR
jgi:RNA-directed DNA polymerase